MNIVDTKDVKDTKVAGHKVLVVDDQANLVLLLQVNLEKEGFTVLTASNGREAFGIAQIQQPALIIMDVMMPEMDGLEALRALRRHPKTHDIPVVLLTARNQPANHVEGRESGANVYLTKPFEIQEVIRLARYYTTD